MNLEEAIKRYSEKNGYPTSTYADIQCACGGKYFHLYSDDEEGGAYIVCSDCGEEQDIENSKQYIEEMVKNKRGR